MPSTSLAIASGWSPAGGNGWCSLNGLLGKVSDQRCRIRRCNKPNESNIDERASLPLPARRRRDGAARPDPRASPKPSSPTRTRKRSTSAWASTTDDDGKVPLLECVRRAEHDLRAEGRAARLPADRRPRRLRQGGAGPGLRRRQFAALKESRVITVQALGGTGGLKVGADFLRQHRARRRGLDQRPELGKPPRAVRERRLQGQHLPLLRRRRPTA